MARARCITCEAEFTAVERRDDLCPSCQRLEDAQYAAVEDLDFQPWHRSRAAMRERLGTLTDRDE